MTKAPKKIIKNDNTKAVLRSETLENILEGHNEELQVALTTSYKGGFGGAETEDDKRIYKYNNQTKQNKDRNKAEYYLESDRGTEEDIYDAIDTKLIKEAKTLTPKSKYQGTVENIDQRGNAHLTFFDGDSYGTLRAREVKAYENAHNKALKEGDKVFVRYQGPNKKGKFMFTLLRDKKKIKTKKAADKKNKQALQKAA